MRRVKTYAGWAVGCALLVSAGAALGQGGDARLGLGLKALVQGKDRPAIILRPRADISRVKVVLERADGKKIQLKSGRLRAGKTRELSFKQPVGVHSYVASFDITWSDGDASNFKTTFKITRVGPIKLQIGPGDVDMEARRMVFRLSNPTARAELVILGDRGRRLDVVEVDYQAAPPGDAVELRWDAVEGDILRMDLKVTDIAGFWAGMQITPFSIQIPHDEVVFESGQHGIRATEAPKLVKTMGHIHEAIEQHGTMLALSLYVGGYTDTVGSRGSNQGLSTRRARSISSWFRSHGVRVPIYYQGFGEDVLAVKTPDETDEPRNRRALYILSSQSPSGPGFGAKGWKRL